MSFGISIGDVIAVSKELKSTISSLRSASNATSGYATLVNSEIGTLEIVLQDISVNAALSTDNGVCLAATGCKEVLDDFLVTLKKYQVLTSPAEDENVTGGISWRRDRVVKVGRKLQWGFQMDDEVRRFRERLAPRIACLQLRLLSSSL